MSKKDSSKKSRTDWERIDAMKDEGIDTSDIPELDETFWKNAKVRMPKNKTSITIRLDAEVLEWFKAQGAGYQTRINAVLRSYMEAQKQDVTG